MKDLAKKNILPYRESDVPLTDDEIESFLGILTGWKIVEREGIPRLEKSFPFDGFRGAMVFTLTRLQTWLKKQITTLPSW